MQAITHNGRISRIAFGVNARAAILAKPGKIQLTTVVIRDPEPSEVRVRLEGCGVCSSNLPVWQGQPWFEYPLPPGAPGHEAWGSIESLGSDVTDLQVGDRVTMLSAHAYADYDLARRDDVIKLPSFLNDKPFPGEPLGCAMNIFERSRISPGETLAIVGCGFLGLLLTQLATTVGVRVIAISRRAFALDAARKFGADATIPFAMDQEQTTQSVMQLTNGHGCDCVIEAVGKQCALDLATELTCERGRLVIAGYHQDGPRQVNMQLWNWRGLDVINAHERDTRVYLQGMARAIGAVESGQLNPQTLFTHTFGLEELPEAFRAAAERPPGFVKALVML